MLGQKVTKDLILETDRSLSTYDCYGLGGSIIEEDLRKMAELLFDLDPEDVFGVVLLVIFVGVLLLLLIIYIRAGR